jgi:hypothetical protein
MDYNLTSHFPIQCPVRRWTLFSCIVLFMYFQNNFHNKHHILRKLTRPRVHWLSAAPSTLAGDRGSALVSARCLYTWQESLRLSAAQSTLTGDRGSAVLSACCLYTWQQSLRLSAAQSTLTRDRGSTVLSARCQYTRLQSPRLIVCSMSSLEAPLWVQVHFEQATVTRRPVIIPQQFANTMTPHNLYTDITLANSTEECPWKLIVSHLSINLRVLWNNVHKAGHITLSRVTWNNPVWTLTPVLFKIQFDVSLELMHRFPNWHIFLRFSD